MNDFPELIKEEIKHGKVDFLHVVNNPRYRKILLQIFLI